MEFSRRPGAPNSSPVAVPAQAQTCSFYSSYEKKRWGVHNDSLYCRKKAFEAFAVFTTGALFSRRKGRGRLGRRIGVACAYQTEAAWGD